MYIDLYVGKDLTVICVLCCSTPLRSSRQGGKKPRRVNSLAHPTKAKATAGPDTPGSQSPGQVALIISLMTLETVNFSGCT